jgi:small subunit ribosomal protein S16
MKRLGRAHRPYFRICAMDKRTPRDGRVLEELGAYDPSVEDTDARAVLKKERIDYWLSVGAQPSEKVAVLIKKYGTNGTHIQQQSEALEKLSQPRVVPSAGPAVSKPNQAEEAKTEAPPAEAGAEATATVATATAEPAAAAPAEAAPEEEKKDETSSN